MSKFKKVFAVFVSVVLFAVCGFLTGCGNKYKKLSWEISYYVSQGENEEWTKVEDNNLELFFGKNQNLITDNDGTIHANLYIKATIKGVKNSNLGQIIVTNAGNGTDNGGNAIPAVSTIKNKEYITIPLNLTNQERIITKLNFREINSGKSTSIDLKIAPKLTGVEMNINSLTAVAIGGNVALDALTAIEYLPSGSTERGAKFSFEGVVGKYVTVDENGAKNVRFEQDSTADTSGISVTENGIVSVTGNYKLTPNNYVIRVKATSLVDGVQPCDVDVYVVDGVSRSLDLKFKDAEGNLGAPIQNEFSLYINRNSDKTATESKFNSVDVLLDTEQISSNLYLHGVQTANPEIVAKYEPSIYINDNLVDAGSLRSGLIVSGEDNVYTVKAADPTVESGTTRKLGFKYELKGLNGGAIVPNFATEDVNVKIEYLPSSIVANNLTDTKPDTQDLDVIIYSTQSEVSTSFSVLPINAKFEDGNGENKITIEQERTNQNGTLKFNGTAGSVSVYENEQVRISLDEGSRASFTVKVRNVPRTFAGKEVMAEYLEMRVNVEKVVTASKVQAYANKATKWNADITDGAVNLDFNTVSSAYLKVYYNKIGEQDFDASTVNLSLSNSYVKFRVGDNQLSTINLSQATELDGAGEENGQSYKWFQIDLVNNGLNLMQTCDVNISVANGRIGLDVGTDNAFTVRYVKPANGEFEVVSVAENDDCIQVGKNNYALAITGELSEFVVKDQTDSNSIKEIKVRPSSKVLPNAEHFNQNALAGLNPLILYREGANFSFRARLEYTELVDVYIHYYKFEQNGEDAGIIILNKQQDTSGQEQPILTAQFAAFNAAKTINIKAENADMDLDNLRIAYKKGFEDAGKLSINLSTSASIRNSIYFANLESEQIEEYAVDNVNDLAVRYPQNNENVLRTGTLSFEGDKLTFGMTAGAENDKTFTINLTDDIEIKRLTISVGVYRLGKFVEKYVLTVSVVEFVDSSSVVVSAADGVTDKSFIDGKDVTFNLTAQVEWRNRTDANSSIINGKLGYTLYKYQQENNGDIAYNTEKQPIYQGVYGEDSPLSGFNIAIDNYAQVDARTLTANITLTALYTGSNTSLGGLYKLVVYTLDSATDEGKYDNLTEIILSLGDGSLKNKFVISSAADFAKINNNMSAHYVLDSDIELGEDFVPIGARENGEVEAFKGSLNGRQVVHLNDTDVYIQNHKITLTLNLASAVEYTTNGTTDYLLGLFAYVATSDEDSGINNVANLDVDVQFVGTFDEKVTSAVVGVVATINRGRISEINVAFDGNINFGLGIDNGETKLAFGGYAGRNFGRLNVGDATVVANEIGITTAFIANNLGLIAGENLGGEAEIIGGFNGELTALSSNIIAHVSLSTSSSLSPTANFGVAVGLMQSGKLEKVSCSGNISCAGSGAYVGMVGEATNAKISNCIDLGLSIENNATNGAIAGILAYSKGGNSITDCKVIFEFTSSQNTAINSFKSSSENVSIAGLLVQNNSENADTIAYSTVETICDSADYAISGAAHVAGVAYGTNVTINNSFASINISGGNGEIYLISNTSTGKEQNSYFFGEVNLDDVSNSLPSTTNIENSYAVVAKESAIYSFYSQNKDEGKNYKTYTIQPIAKSNLLEGVFSAESLDWDMAYSEYYFYTTDDVSYTRAFTKEEIPSDATTYKLKDNWDVGIDYYKSSFGDEVLLYDSASHEFDIDGEYYSTAAIVHDILPNVVNEEGAITNSYKDIWAIGNTNEIHLGDMVVKLPHLLRNGDSLNVERLQSFIVNNVTTSKTAVIKSYNNGQGDYVVLVNYHTLGNAEEDSAQDVIDCNTYNIVKSGANDGLLNVVSYPTDSPLNFEILEGGAYAKIVNGNQIRFTGVTGTQSIRLRISGASNSNVYKDVIFHTQYGVTGLSINDRNNSVYNIASGNSTSESVPEFGANVFVTNSERNESDLTLIVNAQNKKGIKNFYSIFNNLDANLQQYVSIRADLQGESESYLTFTQVGQNLIVKPNLDALKNLEEDNATQKYLISLQFNAAAYFGDSGWGVINLAQAYITFNIYEAASDVYAASVNSEISVGTTAQINAVLETPRTGSEGIYNNITANKSEINPNRLIVDNSSRDSLFIDFDIVEGADAFNKIKVFAGLGGIVDWFEGGINISGVVTDADSGKINYTINLTVKDDFNYRRIDSNIKLAIKISARSNEEKVFTTLILTIKPEQLNVNNVEMVNYKINTNSILDAGRNTITVDSNDTGTIQSGAAGGLLVVRLQPSYANIDIDSIQLTGERVLNTYVQFEQMVYDRETARYITYINNSDIKDGNFVVGKHLAPYSERIKNADGSYDYIYTGTFYVRMYLSKFVPANQPVQIKLSLNAIGEDGVPYPVSLTRNLSTEFTAYVEPSFEDGLAVGLTDVEENRVLAGIKASEEAEPEYFTSYLIQQNSGNNVVKLKLYGYEYNSMPTIIFKRLTPTADAYIYYEDEIMQSVYYTFNTDFNSAPVADSYGAYTIEIYVHVGDISTPFVMETSLSVSLDGQNSFKENKIIFHPVDYIIKDVTIDGVVEGDFNIDLGQSKPLMVQLSTNNNALDLTELYGRLPSTLDEIKALYLADGRVINDENAAFNTMFTISERQTLSSKALVVRAKSPGRIYVSFKLEWYYEKENNGAFNVHFGTQANPQASGNKTINFVMSVVARSTEEAPTEIRTADEFTALNNTVSDANYILMADITLENYTPISAQFNSFDGNNHIITIKSFSSNNLQEYGLFASVDYHGDNQKTTIENLIVAYYNVNLDLTNNVNATINNVNQYGIVFGGLVARLNEGGLIYNCDVMNITLSEVPTDTCVNITMPNDETARITFGGLVGVNLNGIITNSRVGNPTYLQIRENDGVILSNSLNSDTITFNIGSGSEDVNQFVGITGGFVGVNTGRISSSFVQRTNLFNYSKSESSQTAGFVAQNDEGSVISYSYVKSLPTSNVNAISTGTAIENKSNGNVAGFVHLNKGEISNSYANVEVKSQSTFISGFVFENANTGYIHECYAAATLNQGRQQEASRISEQPFVGFKDGKVLSNGRMENVYYYDYSSTIKQQPAFGLPEALPLNNANIQNPKYLHGFAFVLGNNVMSERNEGVWSYYEYNSNSHRDLPELNTANNIAHSYRYSSSVTEEDGSVRTELVYAYGYGKGEANNPYIIRDVVDYKNIFTPQEDSQNFTGYVRFVNDIDFSNNTIPATSTNFTLGGSDAITSIEGNGMKILNVGLQTDIEYNQEIGLFAHIKNSYIKNLTVNLGSKPDVRSTKYLGGLAGRIEDSVIVNVNIDGHDVVLEGYNFVGGLAGMITGQSLIYGVTSNVSVLADARDEAFNIYYNRADYNKMQANFKDFSKLDYQTYLDNTDLDNTESNNSGGLSYAGGIAGVIDLTKRGQEEFSMQFVTVYQPNSIEADFAGGVAGYFGGGSMENQIKAKKIKFYTLTNAGETISGSTITGGNTAGGLFAISSASIEASQVTSVEKQVDSKAEFNQYEIDTAIGSYITALENGEENAALDVNATGNMSLINGAHYAGGLVGISLGANIYSSYAKAGFTLKNATESTVIGGLVGLDFGGQATYSYAVPFVNADSNKTVAALGGLIGRLYENNESIGLGENKENELKYYTFNVFKQEVTAERSTLITQYTYSTLIKDKNINLSAKNNAIDYFIGQDLSADKNVNTVSDYVGPNNTFKEAVDNWGGRIESERLASLYNTHLSTFDKIFGAYINTSYWDIDPENYFPLLLDERATNRIPIESVSDLDRLVGDPEGDYELRNDITVDMKNKNSNYVLDINFKGSLISNTPTGATATITIKNFKPGHEGTAGFFRKTEGATIRNVIFNFAPDTPDEIASDVDFSAGVWTSARLDVFGGISPEAVGASFEQVQVTSYDKTNNNISNLLATYSNGTIAGFGGIVGVAENTKFQDCTFDAGLNVCIANTEGMLVKNSVAVGAIAAQATAVAADGEEDSKLNKNLSVINAVVGQGTRFNLRMSERDGVTIDEANIGLAFGSLTNNADDDFNNCTVDSALIGNSTNQAELNVSFRATSLNVGGFAGYMMGFTKAENAKIFAKIALKDIQESGVSTAKVGGFAGAAAGSIEQDIAQVDISLTNVKLSNAALAGGVAAQLSSELQISECTFMGKISATNQTVVADTTTTLTNEITNIAAAGVVGDKLGDTKLTIDTVFAYPIVDVGTSSTKTLHMGGVVANNKANTTISNVVVAGRLMADNSNIEALSDEEHGTASGLYVGGLVGYGGNAAVTIGNAIVLTSILMDGLKNNNAENLSNVNALFGGHVGSVIVKVQNSDGSVTDDTWIAYSSDYALVAENSDKESDASQDDHIYNLEAAKMIGGNWLNSNENFAKTTGVPYLAKIAGQLNSVGILTGTYYNTNLAEASQLNPKTVNSNDDFTTTNYKYYILNSNYSTLQAFNIEFYGFLLGNGNITVDNNLQLQTTEPGADNFAGIIPTVTKHSAISNLHIVLPSELKISNTSNVGILVGENDGVVSNCSVMGAGVNLSLANDDSTRVAGLVGNNNGLMQYCYSSAEYISLTNINYFAGLVFNNNSKLAYSYFTGYINNEGCTAYGIAYNLNDDSYIYSNYMAGILTAINGNSFGNQLDNATGEYNLIDAYANAEQITVRDEVDAESLQYQIVGTAQIMQGSSESGLQGKWHSIVAQNDDKYILAENASTFGYNYGYPIYAFNKVETFNSYGHLDESYTLYTGRGVWQENDLNGTPIAQTTTQRAENLLNNTTEANKKAYVDAYKIPHLGVLQSINMLSNKNLNFVLIYNINGKIGDETSTTYKAINSVGSDNCGGFAPVLQAGETAKFTGVVVSNLLLNFTSPSYDESMLDTAITISNISTNGLFTNISNSYLGNIKFAGNFTLGENETNITNNEQASGVLGGLVDGGEVIVKDIAFETETAAAYDQRTISITNVSAQSTRTSAALFGIVNTNSAVILNNVLLQNIVMSNNAVDSESEVKSYSGLVAGINKGKITFTSKIDYSVEFHTSIYAGGLVGYLTSGSGEDAENGAIIFDNKNVGVGDVNTIKIITTANDGIRSKKPTKYFGGVVGLASFGTIKGVDTTSTLDVDLTDEVNANYFGGVAAEISNRLSVNNNLIIALTANITEEVDIINNVMFGGVAAKLNNAAEVEIANFVLGVGLGAEESSNLLFNISAPDENTELSAVGGLFGQFDNATANINFVKFNLAIDASTGAKRGKENVGGFVGIANGGLLTTNLTEEESDQTVEISVCGSKNVGGLFGTVNKLIAANLDADTDPLYNAYYKGISNLHITVNLKPQQSNIGGLIGLYDGELEDVVGIVTKTNGSENMQTITSKATIKFISDDANSSASMNIGGVIGSVQKAKAVGNLTFDGTFDYYEESHYFNENSLTYIEDATSGRSFSSINVGGVIGELGLNTSADGIQPSRVEAFNLTNRRAVYGYQNVGGLVGYAVNADIHQVQKQSTLGENEETISNNNNVYGVVNVGGLVGASINSTIGETEADSVLGTHTLAGLINEGSVYGNYDVGGLVGVAYTDTQTSPVLGSISSSKVASNVIIKGVPYFVVGKNAFEEQKVVSYVPSNVGGLVGFAAKVSLIHNVLDNGVQITSGEEGESISTSATSGLVISTISNYMGSLLYNDISNDDIVESYININTADGVASGVLFGCVNAEEHKVRFSDIKSGYGGLVGGIMQINAENNTLNEISIGAQLGINVGGLFGYVDNLNIKTEESEETISFSDLIGEVTIAGNVSVNGGYCIGGVAGYVSTGHSIEFSNENLTGRTITIQSLYTGMYVGGLFGKLDAGGEDNLSLVNSSAKITIDTSKSYYMGGLVGMYHCSANTTLTGNIEDDVTNSGITGSNSIGEFGGFVGMLKLDKTGDSLDITIKNGGNQPYAFTVNTVENGNYFDGTSITEAQKLNQDINLVAMATYVNQDKLTICPTSDNKWYTITDENKNADSQNGNNPLKPKASTGWAKEYTMFKTMQRSMPAGKSYGASNTTEWDAISVVYDASNITYVATHSNSASTLGKQLGIGGDYKDLETIAKIWKGQIKEDKDGQRYYDFESENGYPVVIGDYIVCTIYEAVEGQPMLYSKMGIAEPVLDEDGEYSVPPRKDKNSLGVLGFMLGFNDLPSSSVPLVLSYTNTEDCESAPAMDEIFSDEYYRELDENGNPTNAKRQIKSTNDELVTYNYKLNNYYQANSTDDNKFKDTWFSFTYFYESPWLGGDDKRPADGCIFNVTGVSTEQVNNELTGGVNITWIILRAVGALVEIWVTSAITAATFGAGGAAIGLGAMAAQVTNIAAEGAILAGTLMAVYQGLALYSFWAGQKASNTYFQVQDASIGFLGMSYQREVMYSFDGEGNMQMNTASDGSYTDIKTGITYIYYTSNRPSDFYQHRYYVYYNYNENAQGNKKVDTALVGLEDKDLTFTHHDPNILTTSKTFAGARECTYKGSKAWCYDYYIYHNGAYYVIMDAVTIEYVPSQSFFNRQDPNQEILDYINDTYIYVRGSYENGHYTIGENNDMGNFLYYNGDNLVRQGFPTEDFNKGTKTFKIGDHTIKFETTAQNTYMPVSDTYYKQDYEEKDNILVYKHGTKDLYYGYGYMKGAYYAPIGTQTTLMDIEDGVIKPSEVVKTGKYRKAKDGDNISSMQLGVDYIQVKYANGSIVNYVYDSETSGDYNVGTVNSNGTAEVNFTATPYDSITVNMYPYSFDSKFSNMPHDEYYYILSSAVDKNFAENGVPHTATYFYYDGGYETGTEEGNKDLVFTELILTPGNKIEYNNKAYNLYSDTELRRLTILIDEANSTSAPEGISDSFRPIKIYAPGTNTSTKLTLSEFMEGYDDDTHKYKNYYILPNKSISEIDDMAIKEVYKVSNNYCIVGERIFAVNQRNAIQGALTYSNIIYPNTGDGDVSYNYNKYCFNKDLGIYTRYYYNNGFDDSNGIKIGDYWLYKPNATWPNGGTTYFVESVRVILGGNKFIYNNQEIADIGKINCD